jgi:hypothetical protein
MTNETYEERMAREKAKRKRERELEEAMLIGFMAGNMGSVYTMVAAEAAASGGEF